jgi:hypothetical protein
MIYEFLSFFTTLYLQTWAFALFLVLHYGLMLAWIRMTGTGFCSSPAGVNHPLAELLYEAVMAGIFIFDILNVSEGPTLRRYNAFDLELTAARELYSCDRWGR